MKTFQVTVSNVSHMVITAKDEAEAMKLADQRLITGDISEVEENSLGWDVTDVQEDES